MQTRVREDNVLNLLRVIILIVFLFSCSPFPTIKKDVAKLKSQTYTVSRLNENWEPMENTKSDLSLWSKKTGTIISINSICDRYAEVPISHLKGTYIASLQNPKILEERTQQFDGRKAFVTVVQGTLDGVPMKVRHIVLNKNFCTYDFVMAASPHSYGTDLLLFNEFMESFHAE